jgi:hypothetical protein
MSLILQSVLAQHEDSAACLRVWWESVQKLEQAAQFVRCNRYNMRVQTIVSVHFGQHWPSEIGIANNILSWLLMSINSAVLARSSDVDTCKRWPSFPHFKLLALDGVRTKKRNVSGRLLRKINSPRQCSPAAFELARQKSSCPLAQLIEQSAMVGGLAPPYST